MIRILEISDICTACMACYNICPTNAIAMQEDIDGFFMPVINPKRCIECLNCERVCPQLNTEEPRPDLTQKSYYGWHNDDHIRHKSSSGGVFSALAVKTIDDGGVVFGAVYNHNLRMVVHSSTAEVELDQMRKSKYVQSYIGDSFRKAKESLIRQQRVLFVGTPCQIAGLLRFTGLHEKLLTCDFVCHGVPAMRTLRSNLDLIQKKYGNEIIGFDFRPKIISWRYDYLTVYTKNRGQKHIPWSDDSFFKGFIDNLILRKSCYKCSHATKQHSSDVTLADFWGYRSYDEKLFDNRGLSLILANTNKGSEFLESADKKALTLKPLDWQYARYIFSQRTEKSYNIEARNDFFAYTNEHGYLKAVRKYGLVPSFSKKMHRIGGSLKKKIADMLM